MSSKTRTTSSRRSSTRSGSGSVERERADAEAGVGHVGDRAEPVTGDVTDREPERATGERDDRVPVATDLRRARRRHVPRRDRDPGHRRQLGREQRLLQRRDDALLLLELLGDDRAVVLAVA